jgi:5,10-methylenetetrahydromethanopterin reductase
VGGGATTFTGTVEELSARLDDLAAAGVTEVAYQPAGDIERELRAFARLAPSVTAPSAWPR